MTAAGVPAAAVSGGASPEATEALAAYVSELTYEDLPREAVQNAKIAILDTVGVALAGSRHEVGRLIAEYVGGQSSRGSAAVFGRSFRASPELAALANGVMAHALDFDDRGHASTHTLTAALALGDAREISGRGLLLSYVVGREVRMHLNDEFDRGRFAGRGPGARGWHATGTLGTLGATAAAAKALGLDRRTTQVALGIAASLASGLMANFGTMTKPLHAGNAARNGVLAATLARSGFTAETGILTARRGFVEAFSLPGECDIEAVVRNLRTTFHTASRGVRIKPYPSCSGSHPYIEAMRRLRSNHDLRPESVELITCTPAPSLNRPYPHTDLEGKFSAAFCLAATLIDGEVNLRNCTDAFLRRADVQALLARIRYEEAPVEKAFVRVQLTTGEEYEQPLPPVRNLTSYEEIREKFYRCAVPVIGDARARQLEAAIADLDGLASVRVLTGLVQA